MEPMKVVAIQIDERGRNILLLWDGPFSQIRLDNPGGNAAPFLPSLKHGAYIQMSKPLALSGLYPQILPFRKLANFQH